ncbi:MAG TPA: hypothetical protein PLF40_06235 [Kofleriaceae bacterium]|nr:hypothetical protein [Kofleriaceae bacterium]
MASPNQNEVTTIGILDANRSVTGRVARVMGAAAQWAGVSASDDPLTLREQLSPDAVLLASDGDNLELIADWSHTRFPQACVVAWSSGDLTPLINLAQVYPQITSLLGWPSFQSSPRPWELALATRYAIAAPHHPTPLSDILFGQPAMLRSQPRTSGELHAVATTFAKQAAASGATARVASRVGEVTHELLMNAMYDAPVNHYGEARYAFDRRASIELEDHEMPIAEFATDGILVAVQVTDPFGRLSRKQVLAGIARGQAAAHSSDVNRFIDSSHGGAGLGMWRIYSSASVAIVDVIPGHSTTVTAVFDIDVGQRDARSIPSSLHLFDRATRR